MKHKAIGLFLLPGICFMFLLPMPASAAPRITLKPKVSTSWRMDTNYYGAEENEREVYTYLVQAGFELGVNTPKSSLGLDYTLNANYYDDRDAVPPGEKSTDEDNYIGHTLAFTARHQASDRVLVGLDDTFYKTRDPAQSDELSNSVDREKYYINRLTPLVYYDFGPRFSVGLRYQNTKIDYDPRDSEDAKEDRGALDVVYHFSRRATMDLEGQHWERDYDGTTSDYASNQVRLIFKRKLRHFSIVAGAGYHSRDFDDPNLEDIDVFTYHINLEGDGTLANRRTYVSFRTDQNLNDQGLGNQYFKATRFTLSAGHEFTKKVSGDIQAYYQISNYEGTFGVTDDGSLEERKDDTYDVSGTITYAFARWLSCSLKGGYTKRNSNLAGRNYENRYGLVSIDFAYGPKGRGRVEKTDLGY